MRKYSNMRIYGANLQGPGIWDIPAGFHKPSGIGFLRKSYWSGSRRQRGREGIPGPYRK